MHFLNAVAESSITTMVADQIRSFDADQYEWHVIGLRGVETTSPFDGHDVKVVDFQESASGFVRLRRDLKDYIRRHNIQLVHTHTPRATVIVSLTLGYPRQAKLVTTKHSPVATERASLEWLFTMVDRAATYAPDHLIAVSGDLGNRILSLPGVSQERVTVIPNAVDVAKYDVPQERTGCREEFGIPANAPLIGFAGRLTHVKRIDLLLEAFRIVREQFPASRLLIAGDGEEMEAKRILSRELGVESAVIWTGHRQDVERLFSAMDVYVQSSIHEGLSLSLLQAMATRTPVVATDVGGTREIVSDQTGVLIPPGCSDTIADAIVAVLSDREATDRRVANAHQHVLKHCSIDQQMSGYSRVYEQLLD